MWDFDGHHLLCSRCRKDLNKSTHFPWVVFEFLHNPRSLVSDHTASWDSRSGSRGRKLAMTSVRFHQCLTDTRYKENSRRSRPPTSTGRSVHLCCWLSEFYSQLKESGL